MKGGTIVLIMFFSLFCGIFGKDHVPVLIWNTNQSQGGVPAVSALQFINYGTFQAKYLAAFLPKNILLFLQDAVSVEDLSSHRSEFRHVRQWLEKSHSLYLPNVENPAHLAHDLPSHGYNVVVLEPGVPAGGLELKQENNNLVVVKLPSTLTNPSRSRALQKADEVMQNVISKVGEKREFTVIYTGLKPSVEDRSEQYEERIRVARSLKSTEEFPLGFHNGGCTLLYLHSNMTLNYYKQNSTTKREYLGSDVIDESRSVVTATGDCSEKRATIRIKYTELELEGTVHPKVAFEFNFYIKYDQWYFKGIDEHIQASSFSFSLGKTDIAGIPMNISYSCSQKLYLRSNDSSIKGNIMELVINGIQVQPYNYIDQVKFNNAWDCVGFFTVPIWASLLTTLLLLVILSFGMYMLSDIKTMDRFDDPKAQPIVVQTAE